MSDADDKAFETMQLMDTLGTAIYSEQRMHLKQKYDVDIEDFRYDGWKEYRLCGAKEVIMLCAEEAMNLVNMNRRRWNRKWPRNTPHMCVCLPASHGKTANAPPCMDRGLPPMPSPQKYSRGRIYACEHCAHGNARCQVFVLPFRSR